MVGYVSAVLVFGNSEVRGMELLVVEAEVDGLGGIHTVTAAGSVYDGGVYVCILFSILEHTFGKCVVACGVALTVEVTREECGILFKLL